jgi:hypothetical protein
MYVGYLDSTSIRCRGPDVGRHGLMEAGYRQCERDWPAQHFIPTVLPYVRQPATSGAPVQPSTRDFDFDFDV